MISIGIIAVAVAWNALLWNLDSNVETDFLLS